MPASRGNADGIHRRQVRPRHHAGGYTRSLGDTNATNAGTAAGTEGSPYADDVTKAFFDKLGLMARLGRGQTDTDITYVELMNENGTSVFIFPNAAGNGVTVQTTKP